MNDSITYRSDPEFGRRFQHAVKMAPLPYREMNQIELAKDFDISHQAIHTYLRGTRIPLIRNGIDICKKLNVSIAWLYMGEGPMRPIDFGSFPDLTRQITELNEEQRTLIQWEVSLFLKDQLDHTALRDAIIRLMS